MPCRRGGGGGVGLVGGGGGGGVRVDVNEDNKAYRAVRIVCLELNFYD